MLGSGNYGLSTVRTVTQFVCPYCEEPLVSEPGGTDAAVLHDHVLRLLFDDGTVGDVDFSYEEWTGVLEPLREPAYFARCTATGRPGRSCGPMAWTCRLTLCTRRPKRTRSQRPS